MTNTIAVTQQKGGVGKTTCGINVAGALNERGHDVLFIDLDPQGNATEGLGLNSAYDSQPPSLFDVLTDHEQRAAINDLVEHHAEMDVLPSNIDMTSVEPELTLSRRGGEQLALALEELETEYDYILIDCPPYLGYLTDNALFAAQNVLIPALTESTSKRALELLYDHMAVLEGDYGIVIEERGVIANRIDVRKNEAQEMLEWFETAYPDMPVWRVRERAKIQRSFSNGHSIFAEEEPGDMAEVFLEIADGLDEQFEVSQ